ncbi:MAG: hypothetical protein M1363_01610, partial [Gammaproteobacteria bacterium]|nr:hypothetical protein [Gammaproteobacteria bacterium]
AQFWQRTRWLTALIAIGGVTYVVSWFLFGGRLRAIRAQ